MKKLIIPLCVLLITLFTVLLDGDCLAQEQISGGWTLAAVTKPEVVAAAHFAVAEQAKVIEKELKTATKLSLVTIISAEEQVVSGMNYHLALKVKLNGKRKKAEATVWWQAWNKDAPYKLTAWKWK
ncbi:cystatin domain-containing protein [Trichlorobacter lovleyi]|uniref:Proteinase inhibitor I25 cystatin n=1 Tax=Trichlorobacter lovleyi (strain ATCC BAA-1151 / DSM 17278 / SZ) TaxID=398767 RepID=B3E5P9_TRIL1|nr:cystatin domain-containing protein [Trichlorobacter lovleyi]ACD96140.1 proteinase inhibitor I25 cystatin [Trichlorobacter lovleyi SZ]